MNTEEFCLDFYHEKITEGKIKLVIPQFSAYISDPSEYALSKTPVFYNPVMELNRDISLLFVKSYQKLSNKKISICDPMTATGVRAIRYAAEIQNVKKVVGGDINSKSVALAKYNIGLNNLKKKVSVKNKDANKLLSAYGAPKKRFDVVDLDPFGTPVPYIDSAIRALRTKGLLATTATDMAPLCGVHPKACIRKYGGKPLRTEYCKEIAVRLLSGCIVTIAAKHDIGSNVVFSHCSDHYIRVYSKIEYGAQKADESIKKLGYILHCFNCFYRELIEKPFLRTVENCPDCGGKLDYAGPLWLDKIFDQQFCDLMEIENVKLASKNVHKIARLVSLIKSEADASPTYYVIDKLSKKLKKPTPPVTLCLEKLKEAGFQASPTHFNTRGIRTNSPVKSINEIICNITK